MRSQREEQRQAVCSETSAKEDEAGREGENAIGKVLFADGKILLSDDDTCSGGENTGVDEPSFRLVMSEEWRRAFKRSEARRKRRTNERRKGRTKGDSRAPAWTREEGENHTPENIMKDLASRYGDLKDVQEILTLEASLSSKFDRLRISTGAVPWPALPLGL
jgi:hypothetical protein